MSVLLLGNGINLQERLTAKWDVLLKDIAERYHFVSEDSLSMTLGYEMLENQILSKNADLKETDIHREIAALVETDAIRNRKDWSGTIHSFLTSLPVSVILTTNYDYAIERSLEPGFKKAFHTRETTYSLHRYQEAGGKTVYHIHGECAYPKTICLGFEQYAGTLQHIRDSIIQNTKVSKEAREKGYEYLLKDIMTGLTVRPEHSWVFDFFLEDVYILGLTLDVSEIDLWWLLSYRSKQLVTRRLPIKNSIVYLDVDPPAEADREAARMRRRRLLETFGVEYILCEGGTFDEKYGSACSFLKNRIK